MAEFKQTIPNIHKILAAIAELEKLPEVRAYIHLLASIANQEKS